MPTPVPHTPCMIVKAGGAGMFSDACIKAMADCGFNPDTFASHKDNKKSQKEAREDLQRKARAKAAGKDTPSDDDPHVSPCSLEGGRGGCRCHWGKQGREASEGYYSESLGRHVGPAEQYARANSESGHMNGDRFFRDSATDSRGDPCRNIPPTEGNSGTYGYDVDGAPCMDHYGKATHRGSPHYNVTRQEDAYERRMKKANRGEISEAELDQAAYESALSAVTGREFKFTADGSMTEKLRKRHKQTSWMSGSQAKVADELSKSVAGADAVTLPASEVDGLSDSESLAASCIFHAYKMGMSDMRSDFEDKYGPGSDKNKNKAGEAWDKLSEPEKKKLLDDHGGDEEKAKLAARQQELENAGVKMPCGAKQPPDSPTKDDCREYQANWLHQNKNEDGSNLPMQGYAGNYPAAQTSSASTTGPTEN